MKGAEVCHHNQPYQPYQIPPVTVRLVEGVYKLKLLVTYCFKIGLYFLKSCDDFSKDIFINLMLKKSVDYV